VEFVGQPQSIPPSSKKPFMNSRDAMTEGGTLTVRTGNVSTNQNDLPAELPAGDFVTVAVEDSGAGMSAEPIAGVTDGTVRLQSRPGRSKGVTLYLPRAPAVAVVAPPIASQLVSRGGARILVVDDDAGVREVTASSLREAGHFISEVSSGAEALSLLARGEPCDLMVIDIGMPGIAGPETVRLARASRPDLKVLYMTGFVDAKLPSSVGQDTDAVIQNLSAIAIWWRACTRRLKET
jgi:CheY-like chemotaxis protein